MAAVTGIGCAVIITVVTGSTIIGDHSMCAIQHVIIAVNWKGGRLPARRRGMAHRAIRRDIERYVVRIGGLVKICGVTAIAGIRSIGIIAMVAGIAVIRNRDMGACKWIHRMVIEGGRRPRCL